MAEEKTNQNIPEEGRRAAPPENISRLRAPGGFAQRMGDAGYLVGRRYDAVKNAFLQYRAAGPKKRALRARISRGGETFSLGREPLAKLCLVGGVLRLFLALDPKAYPAEKYHHRDYTEVIRYARYPMMIRLTSDRQVKNAVELIGELAAAHGLEADPDYRPCDQANIFKPSRRRAARAGETGAAAALIPALEEEVGEPEAIDVRLPVRAKVLNKQGERTGRVRQSRWYEGEGENEVLRGEFRKEGTNVFLYDSEERRAYVDANDNVLSLSNKYLATLRRPRWWLLALILLLILLTLISVLVSAYYLRRTGEDYAPVIFIAEADGTDWNDVENLAVFFNETFGDSVIAPGMSGTYRFRFQNQNADALVYSLAFSEDNPYGIDLRYRLKRDGAYLGEGQYVGAGEIPSADLTIEPLSTALFELEWIWIHNDEADTEAGENQAQYALTITLTARVSEPAVRQAPATALSGLKVGPAGNKPTAVYGASAGPSEQLSPDHAVPGGAADALTVPAFPLWRGAGAEAAVLAFCPAAPTIKETPA